jgi:hypothetical protein
MRLALAFLLLTPTATLAACPDQTILSCPIGKKQLEVCLTGGVATYSFGPRMRPELTLTSAIETLDYIPWNGIGRAMSEAVAFHNGPTSYEVWSSIDRMSAAPQHEGGVNVLKNGNLLAQLTCNPGSWVEDFGTLYIAKEAIGQCWNAGINQWDFCVN